MFSPVARQSGTVKKTPDLVTMLSIVGISGSKDPFLINVAKIVALTSLRDLRYRARILVTQDYLIFGLREEWKILKEGEAYVNVNEFGDTDTRYRGLIVRD